MTAPGFAVASTRPLLGRVLHGGGRSARERRLSSYSDTMYGEPASPATARYREDVKSATRMRRSSA